MCDTNEVDYNSDNMVGSSGLAKNDLIGAVLHVKGSSGALGHAIVVNNATGTTRQTVCYTSYNNCAKNIQLSTRFPSGSNSNQKIFVMVPREFRGSNGAATNYLSADLQNAMVMGSSGVSKTLYGRANATLSELTMEGYAPDATSPEYIFSTRNRMLVSGTVLFDQVGEWRVVVSGTGLRSYTYTVRIV